jgi:aryl-alcohol dehydrogenase-like predicted oxidoreductase
MNLRLLGRSGLRVSELCLGTMTFGTDWGWGAEPDECRRIFERFVAAGGNFVDTSNNYTDGTSEAIVGELVSSERDRYVVATKYSLTLDPDDPNAGGNHRKSLVRSLEQSLRRLRTDYVDVLWLHMRDATTPIEEAVRALDDQVRLGKVLYVGISDSPAWLVAQANTLADLRGWSPFVALQIPYSAADRDPERELLPMAAALGLGVTPWGVLGHGLLTGRPPGERRWPDEQISERGQRVADMVQAVAEDVGASPSQVAIAWLLQRPSPPTIVPIVGARTAAQLADSLGALELVLGDGQLAQIDDAGRPELGFPRAFLESGGVRRLIYGSTWERLSAAS